MLIHLAGPGGNPTGVGAAIRLISGEQIGLTREVQAGGGYWSQKGAVQVMASPSLITGVQVRWPGGKETVSKIPGPARKIKVHQDGTVKTVK